MKKTLMSMLLIFAASCGRESVELKHVSQIETRTRGMGFVDEKSVDAGMAGNTCRFDIRSGVIVTDQDVVQGEEDAVADAYDGSTIVISKSGGFVMNENFENSNLVPVFPGNSVADARFTEQGVVALLEDAGGCQLGWHTSTGEATSLLGGACPGAEQVDVNRDFAIAYVASGDGITAYTQTESELIAPAASALKWDADTQTLYASAGGRDITAYAADGTVRWVAEMGGRVTSFDDMGAGGAVLAMVETADRRGEIVILDALTGEGRKTIPTPSAALKVVVSSDGSTLAVVLESETHFFIINSDR